MDPPHLNPEPIYVTFFYQDLTSINAIVVHMAVEQIHTFQPLLGWLLTFSSCLVEFLEICIYDS